MFIILVSGLVLVSDIKKMKQTNLQNLKSIIKRFEKGTQTMNSITEVKDNLDKLVIDYIKNRRSKNKT